MKNPPKNKPVKRQNTDSPSSQIEQAIRLQIEQYHHSGPLPDPQTMKAYQEILPNAPERIFRQWEKETEHRQQYEKQALQASINDNRRGQYAAILFVILALSLTAFAVWMGQPWVAGILGSSTIGSVVWAFLKQRHYHTDETEKQPSQEKTQNTNPSPEISPLAITDHV